QTERKRIHAGGSAAWHLIERVGLVQEYVKKLAVRIAAKSVGIECASRSCTQLTEVSPALSERRHGTLFGCALVIAVAFIEPEEESFVVANGAADTAAKLVSFQGLLRRGWILRGVEHVVAEELPERSVKVVRP